MVVYSSSLAIPFLQHCCSVLCKLEVSMVDNEEIQHSMLKENGMDKSWLYRLKERSWMGQFKDNTY